MGAGQQLLRALGSSEGVKGHRGDVGVVTDDARQRHRVELLSLRAAEHTFPLPPKPDGRSITPSGRRKHTATVKLLMLQFE